MEDSILISIKKLLGLSEEDTSFDVDLIIHINSVFGTLFQIGVSEAKGFSITDASSLWTDLSKDSVLVKLIKPYVYLKVRLIFDPPTSGTMVEVVNKEIAEFEWRINTYAEGSYV